MVRAQQALHEILLIGIEEEPEEVLMLKARALIERFKAASAAAHREMGLAGDPEAHLAAELARLRDAVDREIDRRLDEDITDSVCDLLEHLSDHLHAETDAMHEAQEPKVQVYEDKMSAAQEAERRRAMIAEAAYLRAAQRHFEPGHELEDWLAAESALGLRGAPDNAAKTHASG